MARDTDRYSKDQRYEVILDNGEDHSRWSDLLGNVTNVVSGTEHITASRSVSFDKTAGVSADAYIVRPLDVMNGVNLDAFASEGQILSSVYLSSITDVAAYNVALLMSSGTQNGAFYSVADTDLSVGWNHLKFDCPSYTVASGCGVDWTKVKYLGVGVSFDSASDTLAGILVDSVRIQMPTATVNFQPNIDNVIASSEVTVVDSTDSLDLIRVDESPSASTVVIPTKVVVSETDSLYMDVSNTARTTSTKVLPVQHIDSEGKVLKSGADSDSPIYTQDVGGGSGGGGGNMLYISPEDFTAVYTSVSGITLTGLSWTPTIEQFVGITQFNYAGLAASFTPSTNDFDYNSGTGLLNVGGSPGFSSADQGYRVQIYGPDKAFNQPTDSTKSTVLNPLSGDYGFETVADVTNETDDISNYYVAVAGYGKSTIEFFQTGGTDTLNLKVHGTCQSDGTAPASCRYVDITENGLDWLHTDTPTNVITVSGIVCTNKNAGFKYLKLEVEKIGSADDSDYELYVHKGNT